MVSGAQFALGPAVKAGERMLAPNRLEERVDCEPLGAVRESMRGERCKHDAAVLNAQVGQVDKIGSVPAKAFSEAGGVSRIVASREAGLLWQRCVESWNTVDCPLRSVRRRVTS